MESKENMRNIKLVSVVVPVYNQENYLDTSVPSILNQTYPDVEVVLVDDGSTDGTLLVCSQFSKSLTIKMVTQQFEQCIRHQNYDTLLTL